MQILKSQVELYKIKEAGPNKTWADITIDSRGTTGRISIASDYGEWSYHWGACGSPFKVFLRQLDRGYVAVKFGESKYFDQVATIANWKMEVIGARREKIIDSYNARLLFNRIKEIDNNFQGDSALASEVYHCDHLGDFFQGQVYFDYTINPRFIKFWDEVWVPFMQHLKEEKEIEDIKL